MPDPGYSIGVKGGGLDDALHILNPAEPTRTLCDQIAATRNLVTYEEMRADSGSACWTCEDVYQAAASLAVREEEV